MVSMEDLMREKERQRIRDASINAAESGGVSGAVTGALGGAIERGGNWKSILARAALGGLAGGATGGAGTYLGSQIMGAPSEGERGGFTNRAGLGGAIAGGLSGAGLGALLGSGKLKWLSEIPQVAKVVEEGSDTLVGKGIKSLLGSPGAAPRTAAALGLAGAVGGGAYGAGEGMQLDYLDSLKDEERRRGIA